MTPGVTVIRAKGICDPDTGAMAGNGLAVEEGKIRERGWFEEMISRYPGAELLDYPDEYVLPGLINTHVHLEFTPDTEICRMFCRETKEERLEKAFRHAREMLFSGVTTVRDLGSSMETAEGLRKMGQRSDSGLPGLHLSGMPLTEKEGHLAFLGEAADSREELLLAVKQRKEAGCDCIKIIVSGGQNTPGSLPERDAYDRERIRLVTEAAHREKLPVAAHCLTATAFMNCMEAGVDNIEHCSCFVRKQPENLLARVWDQEKMEKYQGDERLFMIGFSNNYHRLDEVREGRRSPAWQERFWLEQEKREAEIFNRLLRLGLRPVIGTDGGCGQTYFHETWLELALLVERCGLSEQEAIWAATVAGAEALGLSGKAGRLTEGYDADLITVRENPFRQIRALAKVEHVMRAGEVIR
ncbi:MAG: amidohydrolase family protein [Lachnospiraceae bacterium]|nr:amidohydrolase family protein [Lachnospiraceae bacterium]